MLRARKGTPTAAPHHARQSGPQHLRQRKCGIRQTRRRDEQGRHVEIMGGDVPRTPQRTRTEGSFKGDDRVDGWAFVGFS